MLQRPVLVCGDDGDDFRAFLESSVPLLRQRYWPTPWCVEARLQTVLGSALRSFLLPRVRTVREVLRLSDGGQVALDWIDTPSPHGEDVGDPRRPTVLVLPGLTGSAQADYVRCVAAAAAALPARCVVYNNRGLGGLPLSTPRLYCALSHDDLAEVVEALGARAPDAPLFAVGISLGGLILAQYLVQWGARAHIAGALVVSSPLDVERAADAMDEPINRPLSYHMARQLVRTVRAHPELAPHWDRLESARSVRQFDAMFTAGHFGFKSAEEYYAAATLRGRLGEVVTPLLCLCAADDPFQPRGALPAAGRRAALAVTARGGHIGFLEGLWPAAAPRNQYIARLTEQYFTALLARPDLLHAPPA